MADYAASVRDHVNGGWEKHHQVGLNNQPFPIGQTVTGLPIAGALAGDQPNRLPHKVAFPRRLRLQVTRLGADGLDEVLNVLVPVVGIENVNPDNVAAPRAPIIDYTSSNTVTNLASVALATNAQTILKVALSAQTQNNLATQPVIYQWRKNLVNIEGANSNQLTVVMGTASNAGDYQCLVANFGGLTYSRVARITLAL